MGGGAGADGAGGAGFSAFPLHARRLKAARTASRNLGAVLQVAMKNGDL
jgi:hypothetical protein